eukprot:TRINITY_DN39513_c0_g1_i1.p1 TRINITY_DN39513_c0_g1~~TRINITY_DN39513_c0_g1_i1.p1  ORF type:complete len:239 (+),score=28.93 TRINITY_DN39513_c0_g1_i1:197-913(+)
MAVLKFLDWIPEFIRFAISGGIGTLLDFLAYRMLYESSLFPVFKATLSWTTAYAMSVVWQHALHALLVFGSFGSGGYCRSLGTTYMAYAASIAFSPFINWMLVEHTRLNHTAAWFATLCLTGVCNYLLLTRSMAHAPPALVILSGGVPISDAMRSGSARDRRESGAPVRHRSSGAMIVTPHSEPGTSRSVDRCSSAVLDDDSPTVAAPPRVDGPVTPHRQSTVVTIGTPKSRSGCSIA